MHTAITRPLARTSHTQSWLFHTANLLYLTILIALRVLTRNGHSLPFSWFDPGLAAVVAQVSFFLLPTLAFIWFTHQPAQATLKLKRLSLGIAARCLMIGLLSWTAFLFLSNLTGALLSSFTMRPTGQATTMIVGGGAPWSALIAVALAAPVCEEVLFRGALLSAYEEHEGTHAIWLVALLFATMHLSIIQVLGALFLGLMAGWVVYRTRSLWAGMLVHVGTNLVSALLTLTMALAPPTDANAATGEQLWNVALLWGGVTLIALLPMFGLLRSIGKRFPAPAHAEKSTDIQTLWSFVFVLIGSLVYLIYDLLH